jgi:hypothetical protein
MLRASESWGGAGSPAIHLRNGFRFQARREGLPLWQTPASYERLLRWECYCRVVSVRTGALVAAIIRKPMTAATSVTNNLGSAE